MPVNPPRKDQETANSWAIALSAGAELVACSLAGFLVGEWLDGKLRTGPWLMLLGAMSGITLGLYQLIKVSAKRRDGR